MISLLDDKPISLHNAHVLKWYRWQVWLAKQQRRLFAQTMLIEWHNEELAKGLE